MLGASNTTDARETLKDFPMTGLVESLDQAVKQQDADIAKAVQEAQAAAHAEQVPGLRIAEG